mmetsp:Transcript_40588/g.69010  ORF Transcript_40588/g.69010 Transcript_40588/m.69010 type:complete len:130 (-) Transcript_40588:163-552(-)|eukprot:CAMPEP_0171616380 /NCGR_PEP_ID=MMETSP0990-20121206/13433_1 /TAXON_ID=483369 /ORGANISM="non described non described, Strain CCMP2098" /LENGTH=129 /DNA_ID=CAMNT_0012180615 /DNA_START=6 /DNA_END=395 /DNA_ORIENTATION=-
MSSVRSDPQREAADYIQKKRIDVLFQDLGTRLVYSRSDDPNAFLLSVLSEMQQNNEGGKKTLFFTDEDITTLFEMFDPTGSGYITEEQYKEALNCFGIGKPVETIPISRINKTQFVQNFEKEVEALSMT